MSQPGGAKGSIAVGALWMLVLGVLLFWLPFLGPMLAGLVGGKRAGGVLPAIVAVFLPGIVTGVAMFFLATLLSGMPVVGFLAGMGGLALAMFQVGPLLLGAILGGLMA
jgi:hypothetical protein